MGEYFRLSSKELKAYLRGKPKTPCVYIMREKTTGKFYIGSTCHMAQRHERHLRDLTNGDHHNRTLQEIFTTEDNLVFDVLWLSTPDEIRTIEQSLLDEHHGKPECLNLGDSAIGAWKVVPESIRAAISERRKGVATTPKGKPRTAEEKLAISIATRAAVAGKPGPNFGKTLSDVTRQRLSEAKSKPVSICGVFYNGTMVAAKALNIPYGKVMKRIYSASERFKDWFYIDESGSKLTDPRHRQVEQTTPVPLDPLLLPL